VTPTRKECLEIIQVHEMLPNIVRHSELVTEVALLIAGKLVEVGQVIDLTLVEAGAMLHDITKTLSIQTRENHAETGGQLLASLGYPAVADVVRQHIRVDRLSSFPDSVSEAEVVNYADKRVKHEEVVDIEERFRDIWERYIRKLPGIQARFEQVQHETRVLEMKIFSMIDISPEDIGTIVLARRESSAGR
jgi:uncharacterized protein